MKDGLTQVKELKDKMHEQYIEIQELNKRAEDLKTINEEHQILNGMLRKENDRLNNIIKHVEDICESSIVSVNQILQDEKETKIVNGRCINRNEYQIVRLKAYRTKSKEILERIKQLKGENNEWRRTNRNIKSIWK